MMTPALLSAALLLLLLPGAPANDYQPYPITIVVTNSVTGTPDQTYPTIVANKGILLGAMKKLQASDVGFRFTYTETQDYGPFLESVNGVAGSLADQTSWQLLVNNGTHWVLANVGIGCYIPSENEKIILNFTKWGKTTEPKLEL